MAKYSQAQLDALRKAYASGALSVRYEDSTVTYRSLEEMDRIISEMEADINAEAGKKATRQIRFYTKRGY